LKDTRFKPVQLTNCIACYLSSVVFRSWEKVQITNNG